MGEDTYKLTVARLALSWWKHRLLMQVAQAALDKQSIEGIIHHETVNMDAEAMAKEFLQWCAAYSPMKGNQ